MPMPLGEFWRKTLDRNANCAELALRVESGDRKQNHLILSEFLF